MGPWQLPPQVPIVGLLFVSGRKLNFKLRHHSLKFSFRAETKLETFPRDPEWWWRGFGGGGGEGKLLSLSLFTRFTVSIEKTQDGFSLSGGRLTRKQTTRRKVQSVTLVTQTKLPALKPHADCRPTPDGPMAPGCPHLVTPSCSPATKRTPLRRHMREDSSISCTRLLEHCL